MWRTTPSGRNLCLWHDPAHAAEVTEARRLGGIRRRREVTIQGAYELAGLGSVEDIRRLVLISVMDALGLESSISRCRVLLQGAQVALRALESGEIEERLRTLEAAVQLHRTAAVDAAFDLDVEG